MIKKNDKKKCKKINDDKNIRIITYEDEVVISKKDKDGNDVKLNKTIRCNVITNLNKDKFDDEKIKKVYLSRWSIEIFFKLIKSNFKFSNLKEHLENRTYEQYNKLYYSILIIVYISSFIEKINDKYNGSVKNKSKNKKNKKNKRNKKNNYNIKNNKTLLISGIRLILNKIIGANVQKDDILSITNSYLLKVNVIKDIINERICKTPHSKWYVQSYAEHYRYIALIDAIKSGDISKLNNNLKLLLKDIKIIE